MNFLNYPMRIILLIVAALMLNACVSNRKVQILQKDDVNKKGLLKDTVVRTYTSDTFQYKVQAYDMILVQIQSLTNKEFDFLSNSQVQSGGGTSPTGEIVDENGEIQLPVIGMVKVAGLSTFEIENKIKEVASQYVDAPLVRVRLINYRVTFMGEVAREGTVTLSNSRVTLIEALAMAGGLGELADRKNIKLIRQNGSQTEVQYINILQEDFIGSPYYYVHQNDVLIVPPLRQRPLRKYILPNLSLVLSLTSVAWIIINITREQ
jgi:polysaccharide biosynthesis/export protein